MKFINATLFTISRNLTINVGNLKILATSMYKKIEKKIGKKIEKKNEKKN